MKVFFTFMTGVALTAQLPRTSSDTPSISSRLSLGSTIENDRRYIIQECDTYTDQVAHALDLTREPLAAAIASAKLGTRSPHGFTAFFKYDKAMNSVIQILSDLDTLRPCRGKDPYPLRLQRPVFACVKAESERFGSLYDPLCVKKDNEAFTVPGFKYVFLCPRYFTNPISPFGPAGKNCLKVADNAFVRDGKEGRLILAQNYILLHELVHFYLGKATLGSRSVPKEVYLSNDCVSLEPEDSLRNPQSYVLFIAMVQQNCWDMPDPFSPPYPMPPGKLNIGNSTEPPVAIDVV